MEKEGVSTRRAHEGGFSGAGNIYILKILVLSVVVNGCFI